VSYGVHSSGIEILAGNISMSVELIQLSPFMS